MRAYFKEIYKYNYDSNRKMIDAFTGAQAEVPEKARVLLSHILNAHTIWLSRIARVESPYKIWDLHETAALAGINESVYKRTMELLNDTELDFQAILSYKTSQGVPYINTVQEVLIHAANHGTYHRGQIASLLKAADITPPVTDYIAYKR